MCRRNAEQFTKLIADLLNSGWDWTSHEPDELTLTEWLALGRAHRVLSREHETITGKCRQYLHLFRGRREYVITRYDLKVHQVGEWCAWLEKNDGITPDVSRRDRLYWI